MMTVYVLRSLKDEQLYVGMTENLDDRLKRHQAGQVPSKKHRRPFELLSSEILPDRTEARKREKFFKSGPGHNACSIDQAMATTFQDNIIFHAGEYIGSSATVPK